MPRLLALAVAVALVSGPTLVAAQGSRSASTGGTGGRAAERPGARSSATTPSLPTARSVSEQVNPAAELVAKRKKLGLDDATVEQLKGLAAAAAERQQPTVALYDSLRTGVHMARNRTRSGMAPPAEEVAMNRERVGLLARTVGALRVQRDKDVEEALAVLPEDKREAATKLLEEQQADLTRGFRRSGAEGAAAAGALAGGSRRP